MHEVKMCVPMIDTKYCSSGGIARAKKLSAERRSEISRQAALAKWKPKIEKATHFGIIKLNDFELPCYVLEDGTRVLSYNGIAKMLGFSEGGGLLERPRFLKSKALLPFISKDLMSRSTNPIKMTVPKGGTIAHAVPATVLPDICAVWLNARKAGVLLSRQIEIAEKAEMLTIAFAKVGIIALVDEATGYQGIRPIDALQKYLETLVSKELAAWAKRFPDEFYENIYKLKGWYWPGMGKNRFQCVGHYTKNLVYQRISTGLLEELEKKNPKDENGFRPNRHHQWLSVDVGNPLLAQHIHAVIMFQRLALQSGYGWNRFLKMVDQVLPKKGETFQLPLNDQKF
jgi:hypothetical protein